MWAMLAIAQRAAHAYRIETAVHACRIHTLGPSIDVWCAYLQLYLVLDYKAKCVQLDHMHDVAFLGQITSLL